MANAARILDMTTHVGIVAGPGCATVLIGGMPAAIVGDLHTCKISTNLPHPPTPFMQGSTSVFIGNMPALRVGDVAGCGAVIISGCPSVVIG